MPFVSYAQNSEDVLLWRAFRDAGAGFYVDVGAFHPDQDSVTRAFHDRGWTGINIEPVPALARRIAQARPRDVTLALAAGAFDGVTTLQVVEDTGLSTTDPDTGVMLDQAGMTPKPLHVPVRRLDGILRDHAPDVVHFLKIDVEGAERAVIEGCDFRARRPRVILVEATRPMSDTPSYADWEGMLLAAGYGFVLFDGLNRYYVADEWAAVLASHFTVPVNVRDDYIRVSDAAWARRAAEQDAAVRQATQRAAAAQEAAQAAYSRAFENARDLGIARVAMTRTEQDRDAVREHQRITEIWARASDAARAASEASRDASEARVAGLEAELDAFRRSTSWRITGPVRALASVARRRPPAPRVLPAPEPPASAEEPVADTTPALVAPAEKPGLRRAVHQFHSGSATGDAVTNSMLLIRRKLLALGYRSEIFVQHIDPALADDLRLLDDLPAHDEYVLIVHHSMGHDALDRVLATPSPKVLYYHNITPPQFLPPVQSLMRYGAAGREQLRLLQPAVSAALAASEYNAIELRRAGFGVVAACSLLFDLDRMREEATARMNEPGQPVTVLFVGRIIESKGQADLVDAFARFRERLGRPARLVLVGRTDSPGEYLTLLDERIRAHGLEGAVIVTGPVPDAELQAQYAVADLYVSLSRHEGFGVPLVEAAVRGIPVLAWPCGAVPYTLPPPAGLLQDRDAGAVAERMLALVRDDDLRAGLIQAQREALDRFSLDRQWPAMQQALAMAGAAPPPDPAAAAALAERLQFTVIGHAEGSYSLAAINRALAAAIEAERPGGVRLVPFENGPADRSRLPDAARTLAERGPPATGPEVVISQHYPIYVPGHVPAERGDLTLALVFWEESLLPRAMIAALDQGFDGVLAPSRFVAKALVDSGLTRPVRVIGQAPDLSVFEAIARQRRPAPARTFLHVSSCFPRKGVDVMLRAYAAAFRDTDPVRLVIKGFPNPHNTVPEQVAALQAHDPHAPRIEVINRDLGPEAMLDLYRDADVMVLPTRGEGLNLPAAEAMAAGVPLIVTGYGGHMDFCNPGNARLLDYRMQPSASHLATPGSLWAEPDHDDLVAALREAAGHGDARRTSLARAEVALRLGRHAMARRLAEASVELMLAPRQPPLRMAWITSWATRCGVAEYSRHLINALPHDPAVASHVVLCDDRAEPDPDGQPRSRPAWDLADHGDVQRLVRAVVSEDPHVIVVQHQPGLIAWSGLATLLNSPVMAGRTVVVTLHTTRELARAASEDREAVCAALGSVARVLVHTRDDLRQMQLLGLSANVTLMPHGVRSPLPPQPVRTERAPLIGCYGFFLPGKGIGELIEAMALLRRTRPGARLRLVNAEYGNPISAAEIACCRSLAAEAGLGDAIEWETRFLPEDESLALLSECDIIAIPTQASRESSSAAVRTALAAGPIVMVTPLALFDDVGDAAARSSGVTPHELAQALDTLLSDPAWQEGVQASAQAWLRAHGWPAVAARMQSMLVGLSRTARAWV